MVARLTARLRSIWYRGRLRLDCRLSGGSLEIHPTVRFRTRVIFRGRGRLLLESEVLLGDPLAGLPHAPILLEARESGSLICIGSRARLTNGVEILSRARVEIGRDCLVGSGARIIDSDFHGLGANERSDPGLMSDVAIGDNVLIGMGVMILKGVRIGKDAVIGASAVVTRAVEPGAIAAGNPAAVIGSVYAGAEVLTL